MEVLQTTDLYALINHVANVLQGALDVPEEFEALKKLGDLHQRQEVMVYYYLAGIFKHLDDIKEDRLA